MRLIIKVSGNIIADDTLIREFSANITSLFNKGYKIGIVVGGGNVIRGRDFQDNKRYVDTVGMYSSLLNGMKLKLFIENSKLYNSFDAPFIEKASFEDIENNVLIFSGGIAFPYFSTDIAAIARAIDIKADMVLKSTLAEGVYIDIDNPEKGIYDQISYKKLIENNINIIDLTASALAIENKIELVVFSGLLSKNMELAIEKKIGTHIIP